MTETPQEQIERLTMQRNEAREIYIRSAQVWASITEDLMAKHAAEIERLRSALGTLMPHVKTGKEQAEFAANERQDTPATEALVNAVAALAAKP